MDRLLTELEMETIRCAINRIVPRDDYPSASDLGVLDFIERLMNEIPGLQDQYRTGSALLNAAVAPNVFPNSSQIEQDRVIGAMEDHPFINLLITQTIEGYYADPGNGGNRDEMAWKMVGFEVTT